MTIYGLFSIAKYILKFVALLKALKFKNANFPFHLLLLFEQGSPIGACECSFTKEHMSFN
jgi:hypothetical protein